MHKLIAILALSTSLLAVTSIYLWTELRDARDQEESLSEATQAQHGADLFRQSSAAQQLAITDLLGAATQQRFEQAEQFISALADERKLVETEIKQRGLEPFVFPTEGVAFTFQDSVIAPGNTSERLKEAAEYNRRIHARAKAMLTSQQLAAFEQMQEQAIVGLKSSLRRQERELATHAANEQK